MSQINLDLKWVFTLFSFTKRKRYLFITIDRVLQQQTQIQHHESEMDESENKFATPKVIA